MNEEGHKRMEVADWLTLIGELEHLRRHELSAYVELHRKSDNSSDEEEAQELEHRATKHYIYSVQCKNIRRSLMLEHPIPEELWCSVKTAAIVKQLGAELGLSGDEGEELYDLCDNICEDALAVDLSGCAACREDRKVEDVESNS